MAEKPDFLGTGWAFPPTFDINQRGVDMVSDEEDIAESLQILLNTQLGERIMQPGYGSDLKSQLFEPMNASLVTYLGDLVETAIIYHEPRIKLDSVSITPDQMPGRLNVSLEYTIRSTNTRFNYVFPFYITEGISPAS
jgi:phage baseplate assembly protein W